MNRMTLVAGPLLAFVLVSLFPLAAASERDPQVTKMLERLPDDLRKMQYLVFRSHLSNQIKWTGPDNNGGQNGYEKLLDQTQAPVAKNKQIHIKKTGSSSAQAMRRARDELKDRVKAWFSSLTSQGYALLEQPEPVIDLDSSYGGAGSDYYAELDLNVTVYATMP